ncbi:MAG: GGDEF domain-containing protein [Candidatus Sulfotelmatobacter sp.]|jgi:diguanylate cyclase (GGDEF)-like protein
MISIKKYLDMAAQPVESAKPQPEVPPQGPDSNKILAALIESNRSVVLSMGNNSVRAFPAIGDLQRGLVRLSRHFDKALSPEQVQETGQQINSQLDTWGSNAAEYFKVKTQEVKELLLTLARTAESMATRDQGYSDQLGHFTRQLQTIADLEDLGQIRASLVRQAAELKTCVDRMAEDNRRAVTYLRTEMTVYETRLREVETLASVDELTGLLNRRSLEGRIELAIEAKRPFCVGLLDLNGFKQINDTHGHAVGDNLLKQFADEVRTNIRTSDVAGRWGGDEFVLLLDSDMKAARAQIERLERWAFGEYTLSPGEKREPIKLAVRASVGLAQWQSGETLAKLVERADQSMYKEKKLAHKQHA